MAEDFRAKVTAELDTAEAESKLNAFLNEKRKLKIDVEVNQDSAKKMASSIEKGIKDTKIDTSGISKQLAGSFNITDKNVISKLQSQMDKMISSLGKTWNGKDFDFGKASGFYSGMDSMVNTVMKNAKIVEGATGSYDAFFNYFKDKKIYVSDELKKAMGEDTYKELLQNNIGKIVRDASKGISIDSLWGEMSSLFPEHFSDNITNQVDQIVHAFDVLHQARADVGQVTTAQNMTAEQLTGISDSAAEQIVAIAAKLKESLQSNIMGASETAKTTIDLDVNVNTDKISSDIRSAVENAGNQAEGALKVNMEVNEEQLVFKIREALSSLATGEEPVKVNLQVNKESLQEDLNLALNEMDLPVHFKIDTEEIESQIRAAVESIQDMEIDLRVNTRDIQNDVDTAVNGATETPELHVPEVDSSGLAQMQQALNGVNAAGIRGQSVFQSLGGSFREAFSAYSLANMMQDGLYKIVDAGKEAVSTVKEFDDLKTNLAMVTGKDKTYTEDLMQSYNELGQEIGSITSDVAESANTWLRQGRSMADTNQLIKDSMVLSKDAQMSSEDAAQVLTSTLNGFKLGADQASRINDILTSIDLKSASDAGGIGTSLQKVASQANNVGMSLEKTAAIIATIKDVTQGSDETIGTSLKSILSRMNNIKAGKFVDDNGEALNDVEKVLNKIGITMRDNNDQFLDSETIIDSVADKWDTLNKNTQKAVSTALGGTHQANSVIAMLDNYDKVKMLTETAYNSEGTAEKKFQDNYLNSLEAKTNALKASLENLSTSLVSDNMYSGFLDGAKAMADFAANTDILQASLAGLASAGGVYAFQQLINLFREFSNMGQAMDISRMTEISTDSFEQLLGLTQGLSESQTRMVLSSTALTEAQRAAVLVNQGMSEAEAQAAVAAMGLSAANEAAAASTFTLSGAMEGMLATLMANPLILVAAGVTAAVTAYSAYKRSIEEAVSSAKSAGNTWEENTTSIQDNISRIQELRTALASGTLTEQEAADAKSELLSIQESLSESYGNQVSGLDLINGSLTEQIALLDQVNEKQSQSFLNENKKGIDKAQKEMEKNRHTYLGRFYDNGSEESEAIKKSIKKLQETYGEDVFKLDSADGIMMDIQFNADASTAKDALNDFMTEVSGIEDQFGETDVTDQLANNAASGLTKAKDVLSEYQDIYKQAQEAELISDDKLYKSGDTEQKASKWISDYAKAVEDYNNAIADGDNSKISEASQKFSELDSTVNGLVENTGMAAYADQVKEVRDELNDTAIANDKFTKAVNGTDTSKFGKSVSDNAKALKEWNLSDTDFRYAFETDGVQEGEDQINALVQAALDAGVISDTSASSVANLASMLAELGVISSSTGSSLDEAADSIGDISERIDKASAALTGIQKAESVLDAQSTGKSISLDDFNSDELADYTSALEYNNGALQLNAEKVRELQKAKAEEQIQTNNSQKAEKQNQYMQNIAQIEQLQDQLRGLTDAKGEEAQAIQSSIDALLSDNDAIVNQCNQLDLLSASLREATGAYQNWLDKQNTSESGDMFDDAMGAMEKIDNVTKNSDSEDYGKAGVDSSVVDAYAAEEKQSSGKVTWDNETGAVDAFAAQVHRSSGLVSWGNETSRVKTHFTATGTVNWTNTTPPTKGAGGANGTAHVSGTAHAAGTAQYNHLSGHAQAIGNWATKTGGTTLVGELGREIVVNPATGTWNTVGDNGAEFVNIPAGSIVFNHLQTEALLDRGFINSRGLAQASGSAMVRGGIPVKQANIASKHTTYSGSKSPSNTDKVVAQAAKDSSSAAKSVTDAAEKVESWEDPWKNAVDWFERFTTKYNNSIDLNEAKAENYSSYENKNKYLDKEIADLSKLKGGYQQAQGYYKYQAEAYADMIGLSQDLRKKVQDGEINIDLLDEDTKSKVEAYQEWYDKIHECESELEKLKKKEKEVDQQKLDNITDRFDELKKVYSTSSSVIESRLKYREENGESQAPGSKYYKDVNSQRKAQEAQAALLEKEMVAYRAQMEKIRKKYGEGHELYKKALAGYNDLRDELYNCKQSAKALSNTMYELKEKAAEYKTAMYQGRSDNLSSFRDYKEATNYKGSKYGNLTVNDYAQAAKTNDQTILALQNQKKIAMAKLKTLSYGSPEYNDKLDEINGYTQKILDLGKANAEFKKAAVEIRFKPFDDTIDSLDELIDDCDTLKDMLDSDTFFSDAGELTKQGAANIALINKGLNAEQQKIADYRAQLKNVQQEYNAGNLTKEQLKEYQKQYKDGIKESSQAIYSYNQEMLKMYEDQVSKENDLLKENVDIRQKAKDAKEDYYQFDKTIKSKNKDINAIKAQIAALEGTTNAAAKAKLEQLKADLAEKEEDLEDTKHDHEIDLISKSYDNLTDQADKALDSTLNAVKANSQMQTAVIEEMLNTTKQKYKDAYTEINQIIADTGLKVSDQFQNNIKDSNLKNEQTDKKKADKTVTGIKDTKVSGSTGTGNTSADKVIRNAATDAQDKTLKKLSLSPKSVVVNVGKTATVKVSFSPASAVNKNFNCTASAKGIVKITQAADNITLKGLKTGKTVIKVQGAGGYCKAVSLNVSVLKDATKNSKIVNSTAKDKKYSLTTEEKNRVLNMSTGQNEKTVKANTKKEAELKKWYKALPAYTGGDAEIEKIKDPLVKHLAKKGKKASNANIIKAASILGYRDAKNVSKWDTKKKNAMVKKLQTFGFSKGGVIRNLIPATMGTLLGDAIMKNGDTGFIGAKPGETVLTQDFTKLLKPTTATMQEFTEVMQKAGTPSVKETPARQEVTMNNDYQFVINGVDVNDMSELKKVIRGELDKHDKELAKEFKKFR